MIKTMLIREIKSELKSSLFGAVIKKIESVTMDPIICGITCLSPDPSINDIAIPCDTCPYLEKNGTCNCRCDDWYPLLAERIVYNSLPETTKLKAEMKALKKKIRKS